MPRRRMMDGRNPYGARGGYVVSSRRARRGGRDRGMDYEYDARNYRGGDMEYGSMRGDRAYQGQDNARGRRDYQPSGQYDMAGGNYGGMRGRGDYESDMHYGGRQGNFQPVEAMGYFTGYYGGGEDMGRGGRGRDYADYEYDMRPMPYYNMRMRDYAGGFGERLSKAELEEWKKELLQKVEEKDKHFFEMSNIIPKAKQLGAQMKDYNEEELVVATALAYNLYCKTGKKYVGNNMDFFIEIAREDLENQDSELTGGEKLAVYYDCIVMGED